MVRVRPSHSSAKTDKHGNDGNDDSDDSAEEQEQDPAFVAFNSVWVRPIQMSDRTPPPTEILPGLQLGGLWVPRGRSWFEANRVTHVASICEYTTGPSIVSLKTCGVSSDLPPTLTHPHSLIQSHSPNG
jgi:hypothetical protein